MSTGNTLMVRDMLGRTYSSGEGSGNFDPQPWWIIVFLIGFIIFEYIKWTFFR